MMRKSPCNVTEALTGNTNWNYRMNENVVWPLSAWQQCQKPVEKIISVLGCCC